MKKLLCQANKQFIYVAVFRLFSILQTTKSLPVESMAKFKYVTEFEIRAAVKMLYPYVSTASGLREWFADEVKSTDGRTFDFVWDGESHHARVTAKRTNSHIKFQFLPEGPTEEADLAYIEFKIDYNEITQSTFLKVVDYSEMDDVQELGALWEQLIVKLKEVMGSGVG
jgi:uncharacterized protein YndB with AHSA1/START domain